MKQTYLALFLLLTLAIASCRKSGNDIDIKTYDSNQIRDYIAANGLSVMKRDTAGGDTSGIYYQITRPGHGAVLNYDTRVAFSYTFKSLDGRYSVTDTVTARNYAAVGLLAPRGLMRVMYYIIKNKGTAARFLIPSRLAYGINGLGRGSNRLPGNQSLDYTINVLDNDNVEAAAAYDDLSIRNYCKANNIDINSYKKTASGLYVKVNQAGNGTVTSVATSTVSVQYTGFLLNNTIFDSNNSETGAPFNLETGVIAGFQQGLIGLTSGAKVDLLIPSKLAYGLDARTGQDVTGQPVVVIPNFSCLRYGVNVISVTN